MRLSQKNKFIVTLLFAVYLVLAIIIINPYQVITKGATTFDFLTLFLASAFSSFFVLSNLKKNNKPTRILFLSSFVLCCVFTGILSWFVKNPNEQVFLLFISAFFIIAIPPTIVVLVFLFFSNYNKVESIELSSSFLTPPKKFFELTNAKGKSTFKVETKKILYFESNDNYVLTFYLDHEENVKKSMDRLSLKSVEAMLAKDTIRFSRVHKSFLINPSYVKGISGRSQAYKVEMQHTQTEIPVSRKFDVSVLESNNQ